MKPSRPENAAPRKRHASVKPKQAEAEQQPRRQPSENMSILVAHRAYEIYMQRIFRGPLDDWFEAEREIASHEPAE